MFNKKIISALLIVSCFCSLKKAHSFNWKQSGLSFAAGIAAIPVTKYICSYFSRKPEPFTCVKIEGVSFDDFIGQEEIVEKAKKIVSNLRENKKRKLRGIFLEGVKGGGKTFLTHIITAELGANLISLTSDVLTQIGPFPVAGKTLLESRLDFVFGFATKKAEKELTIVFLDELESLMKSVPDACDILVEKIYAYTSQCPNLFVIGEFTNVVSSCDVKMYGSGIEKIEFQLPDCKGREELIRHCLKESALEETALDALVQKWSKELLGCSSLDIINFVSYACFLAPQDEVVSGECFEEAYDRCSCGFKSPAFSGGPGIIFKTDDELKIKIGSFDKTLSFDDFIGQKEVVDQAKKFVNTVMRGEECDALGVVRPRGLFIGGSSNNGKTLLARIIADELDAPFLAISESFLKKIPSEEIFKRKLAFILEFAKKEAKHGKVVLYVDDLSGVLPNAYDIVLKQFKLLSDVPNLIFIGKGTLSGYSSPDVVKITIPIPSLKGRKEILSYYLKEKNLEDDVLSNIDRWSRQFLGASSGDLKDFVDQTAMIAVEEGDGSLKLRHLEKAFLKMVYGEKGNIFRSEDELRMTAAHEAGHALGQILSGRDVTCVTIMPNSFAGGVMMSPPDRESVLLGSKTDMLKTVVMGYGGFCAEKILLGVTTGGPVGDLGKISKILYDMVCSFGMGEETEGAILPHVPSEKMKEKFDDEVNILRSKCLSAAMSLLTEHKQMLIKLTDALLEKEIIFQDELYEIVGKPRDEVSALLA